MTLRMSERRLTHSQQCQLVAMILRDVCFFSKQAYYFILFDSKHHCGNKTLSSVKQIRKLLDKIECQLPVRRLGRTPKYGASKKMLNSAELTRPEKQLTLSFPTNTLSMLVTIVFSHFGIHDTQDRKYLKCSGSEQNVFLILFYCLFVFVFFHCCVI